MGEDEQVTVMPCPFKHDDQSIEIQQFEEVYSVTCKTCGAIGPMAESPEQALVFWNLRDLIVVPQDKFDEYMEESNAQKKEIISTYQEGSREGSKKGTKEKQDNAKDS